MLTAFFINLKSNKMHKIIFLLWMLSGKVQPQYDNYGFRDYNDGRELYHIGKDSFLYKGEVLNYIKTGVLKFDERYSDKNGRIEEIQPIDTLYYSISRKDTVLVPFPLYKQGKKLYVIDEYSEQKVYLKAKN